MFINSIDLLVSLVGRFCWQSFGLALPLALTCKHFLANGEPGTHQSDDTPGSSVNFITIKTILSIIFVLVVLSCVLITGVGGGVGVLCAQQLKSIC